MSSPSTEPVLSPSKGSGNVTTSSGHVEQWELRARFAVSLAALYGQEVPAYTTLVDVSRAVNEDFVGAHGADAERLEVSD